MLLVDRRAESIFRALTPAVVFERISDGLIYCQTCLWSAYLATAEAGAKTAHCHR